MPTHPRNPGWHRSKAVWIYCGIVGAVCFFAGRYSISTQPKPHAELPARTIQSIPAEGKFSAPSVQTSTALNSVELGDQAWLELKAKPASPANTSDLARYLERLAVTNPKQSLELAGAEPNRMLRETYMQAALRGWAQTAPVDAAHYAFSLATPAAREAGLNAVFSGAVTADPQKAIQSSHQLVSEYPGEAVGIGGQLIDALCQAGNFHEAADFASSGDDSCRSFWMGNAFSKWASYQPQLAAETASSLTDSDLKNQALHGVVGGWSMADPAGLVQYVVGLQNSSDKSAMIGQALQRWARVDPVAASEWINNNQGGPEMDQGIASVAAMEALKPDVATGWAESITDTKLRSETLVNILRGWATVDLAATKNYFEKTKDLLPDDRNEIIGVISTLSGQSVSR